VRPARVVLWISLSSLLIISCDMLTPGSGASAPVADPNVEDPDPQVPDEPCIEERHAVALSAETEVGVPEDLVPYVLGSHTGALIWSNNNNRTSIELEAWDARAFLVKSAPAAAYIAENSARTCATRLELVVQMALHTGDQRIQYEGALTLRAYGVVETFGSIYLPHDALGDAYHPELRGLCFQGLEIKILLGDTGFSGSFSNDYTQGGCEQPSAQHNLRGAGHWGTRWQSY
jgi:hypothetical protein